MRENIIIQIKSYSIFFYAYWNPPTWLNDVPTFWIILIEKLPFGVRVPSPFLIKFKLFKKKKKYDYRDNYYFEWNSNYSSGKENMNCTVYGKKENV